MIYHLVRLTNVHGDRHDFVFETAAAAIARFADYLVQAELDRTDYKATVSIADKLVHVVIPRPYRETELPALCWSAELIYNRATEDHHAP